MVLAEGPARDALSPGRALGLLILVAVPLLFFRLGELALAEPSEGRYAEVAREMLESGDYITPHLNYQRHFEKPPFAYWMTTLGLRGFGATNFGARCLASCFGLGVVLLTFGIARHLWGARAGLLAGLLLLTQPLFFIVARSVTADIFVTFWATAAIAAFLRWYAAAADEEGWWRWGYFLCLAGGLYTKGPVIYVLALLPVLAFLGLRRDGAALRRFKLARGLALSLLLFLPWLLAVESHTPGVFRYLVLEKATGAMVSSRGYHAEPFWYYGPVLLLGCLPWAWFLPAGAFAQLPGARATREPAEWSGLLIHLWWPLVFAIFTCSASKLMTYLLPVTVPIALATARLWTMAPERVDPAGDVSATVARWMWVACAGVLGLLLPVLYVIPRQESWAGAIPWIPALSGVLLVYVGAAWHTRARAHRTHWLLASVACLLVIFQIGISMRKATEVNFSSVEPIGMRLRAERAPTERVVCYRCSVRSLAFYIEGRVTLVDYDKDDDRFDQGTPGFAENVRFGRQALLDLLQAPERVWVVTKQRYRDENPDLLAHTRLVEQNGSVVLLTNR